MPAQRLLILSVSMGHGHITKPGGLTFVECLVKGRPMPLVSPIPGQEEQNAHLLLENGVALMAGDSLGLLYRLRLPLAAPERLQAMAANARKMGKPLAAKNILQTILNSGASVQ